MSVIHFLNVKEGDCIWIKHNSEHNTIIDVSNAKTINKITESKMENLRGNYNRKEYPVNPIEYLSSYNETDIFRFILTHPDMDHMDGIKALFDELQVTNFWDTENEKIMDDDSDWGQFNKEDWDFYQSIRNSDNNPKTLTLYAGSKGKYYNSDENGTNGGDGLSVLAPTKQLVKEANETEDYNDCSYVILYRTGNKKIIFAGDSAKKTWDYILENHRKEVENVDLLIAPHHGRKTGGNDEYLDVLKPKLTLFGNAKSEYLDYSSWNNRGLEKITNNQADCIIIETKNKKMNVYVTYEKFARDYNSDTYYEERFKAWFIKSI